jgi:hypothetical protein
MNKVYIIIALAAGVAGCQSAASQKQAEITAAADQAVEQCNTRQFRTAMARAQCLNDAERPRLQIAGQFSDLVNVKFATRMALAEAVDKGQMTQAQADLEMAKANSTLMSSGRQRINQDRQLAAQEEIASAASAPPRSVTCNRFGNSVTCF